MTPRSRIVLIVLAVAALVIAFAVASGSGDDDNDNASSTSATTPAATAPPATTGETTPQTTPAETTPAEATPTPAPPVVRVVGGKPQGGVQRIEFAKGDQARFTVRSDVSDEIHVHGYDLMKDVEAGGSVTFSFPAKIDGRFEVELEGRGEQIAELEVTP